MTLDNDIATMSTKHSSLLETSIEEEGKKKKKRKECQMASPMVTTSNHVQVPSWHHVLCVLQGNKTGQNPRLNRPIYSRVESLSPMYKEEIALCFTNARCAKRPFSRETKKKKKKK